MNSNPEWVGYSFDKWRVDGRTKTPHNESSYKRKEKE
jgi:hypothetical protein